MTRRLGCFACLALLLVDTSLSQAATPELKAGVRLTLTGSRLSGWASPEVVDWNNDGLNDIVVGHYSGALSVHLNRGVRPAGIAFETVEVRRQDNFANGGNAIWAWRFNKANCICPGPGRISPRVLDWDNDGKKDLVVGDGQGAQTRVWRNIGTDQKPLFSTHHIQYLPPDAGIRPYHETVQPYIADWNGDGKKDLIMGRNRGVYVYINEGTDAAPSFDFDRSRLGTRIQDVFPVERLSPVLVDWDGDGVQDLLVGSQRGQVWFARNVGSNARPAFEDYDALQAGGKVINTDSDARIAVADLDGDNRIDLLVGGNNGVIRFFQATQPEPKARSQHVRIQRGRTKTVELVGTDDAGRALTYRVLTPPKHGSLAGEAPDLTYTPKKDYEGQDEFTFEVAAGQRASAPARVLIEIQPEDQPPSITAQPTDTLVAIGQPANLHVVADGAAPLSYQWHKDGEPIPRATGSEFSIRESTEDDNANYSVTVTNSMGSVSSRIAALQVKPLPGKTDNVPIIDIKYDSPAVEPAKAGVLTLKRGGNTSVPVTVQLTSRRHHHPVVADVHYVPVPASITLKAEQTTAKVLVTPIDDTLVNGTQQLTFQIVPNPAYRIASRLGAAKMTFFDDDCPHVGITAVKDSQPNKAGRRVFTVTAEPAPRCDTQVTYSVGGTAIGGVDYKTLTGTVTIPAGETTATIVVTPYKQSGPSEKKTVVLTLPNHPFTYFDFYRYLTQGQPRTASVEIASPAVGPQPPKPGSSKQPEDAAVKKLRKEVSKLGWIVFAACSGDPTTDLDLFVMRPDGSQLRNITNTPKFDEYSARVSPDGTRLLYRRTPKIPRSPIATRLPQDVGAAALRTWPTTGTLVISNADGTDPRPLESEGAYAWATWGPEGKRIACLEEVKPEVPIPNKPPSYRIFIRDVDTLDVIQQLRSRGLQSHAIWSPDGKRICGVSKLPPGKMRASKGIEYPLGTGKMMSVEIESGRWTALSKFPDWYPVWATDSDGDWFQGGSPQILHSANNYGICPAYYAMLWRSGLDGEPSQLVFGEFKKHIWGGCTSPDDKYAVFVIGSQSWPLLGQMAIIRLTDAPIARGSSTLFHEVLTDHFPNLKKGPVLDLGRVPAGFDPHWTTAELGK